MAGSTIYGRQNSRKSISPVGHILEEASIRSNILVRQPDHFPRIRQTEPLFERYKQQSAVQLVTFQKAYVLSLSKFVIPKLRRQRQPLTLRPTPSSNPAPRLVKHESGNGVIRVADWPKSRNNLTACKHEAYLVVAFCELINSAVSFISFLLRSDG